MGGSGLACPFHCRRAQAFASQVLAQIPCLCVSGMDRPWKSRKMERCIQIPEAVEAARRFVVLLNSSSKEALSKRAEFP